VERKGVHNVHTLGSGLVRTSAGLGRIGYVSGGVQCLQGLECSSSPTSGTAFPLGVFALTCVHWPSAGPSDSGRGLCLAPRWPVKLCGGGIRALACGPSACWDVGSLGLLSGWWPWLALTYSCPALW
jgi:hypothetical protein